MAKKVRYEKNAPLEPGDKVICIKMSDKFSGVAGGTPGVVKTVSNVFGLNQYYVKWKSGSNLALIDGRICKNCGNEQGSELLKCSNCGSTDLEPIDQWRKVVEEDGLDDLSEGHLFYKTKKQIIKECKK